MQAGNKGKSSSSCWSFSPWIIVGLIVSVLAFGVSLFWINPPSVLAVLLCLIAGACFPLESLIYKLVPRYQERTEILGTIVRGIAAALFVGFLVLAFREYRAELMGGNFLSGALEVAMAVQTCALSLFTALLVLAGLGPRNTRQTASQTD